MTRLSLPAPPRRSLIMLAAALLPLAACDEAAPPPAGPDTGVTAADGEAAAAHRTGPPWDAPGQQVPLAAGNPIDNLNELFAFIALEEPGGFAGVHVEDDRFVIQMVEPGRARAGAMRWIRHFFGDQLRAMPVEFRRADRSFADLMSWYRTFQNVVFEQGAIWTDVRESTNRLEAGLEPASDFESVRQALDRSGLPRDVYRLEPARPAVPLTQLIINPFRPVVGGVKIQVENGVGDLVANATHGFNVRHWDQGRAFVTAGHVTHPMGQVDGHAVRQPDDTAGFETVDPEFWTGTHSVTGDSCPTEYSGGCRYADAAMVTYQADMPDSLGLVARPDCTDCASDDQSNGGVATIDSTQPNFSLVDEVSVLADGQTVNKVGKQTGWETGKVSRTCYTQALDPVDANVNVDLYPEDTALLCQYRAVQDPVRSSSFSESGDSGSPVFLQGSFETTAELSGVLWAGSDSSIVFSTIGGVRVDLDPNTSLSCDGLETLVGGGCSGGDDGDFQECTGDRESFQCEADGSW